MTTDIEVTALCPILWSIHSLSTNMRLFTTAVSFASLAAASLQIISDHGRPICIVKPLGQQQNDAPNILHAFRKCGHSGTIIFPENETYWIAERLNPHVQDVTIDWKGTWLVR